MSDDQLAAAAAAGDQRAFGVIFERYHQPLYRYCASILRDPDLAADALQNTMIAAMRGLEGEERAIALKPWLYRIAHNQSISLLRRRRDEAPLDEAAVAALPAAMDMATRDRLDQLVTDLRDLPDQQRSALLLRELSGLEYDEVATSLGVTSNAARQAVFKARRSLTAVAAGRTMRCEAVQAEMSMNDLRFQRRRDVSAHLESCADCRAFAAALTSRPADLGLLFPALPAAAATSLLASARMEAGAGDSSGGDRKRRAAVLALLLLGLASASVALAATGVFSGDDGDSGKGNGSKAGKVAAGAGGAVAGRGSGSGSRAASPSGGASSSHHRGSRHGSRESADSDSSNSSHVPAAAPAASLPSATTAYATVGERTQAVVGSTPVNCARSGGSGAGSGSGSGSGGGSNGGSSGSRGGAGGNGSAGAGGGSSAASSAPCVTGSGGGGGLPLTGLAVGAVLALALMLLCLGGLVRWATPEPRRR